MTANQISYWQLQETKRANQAKEAETARHNVIQEGISSGTNIETRRSNLAKEQETQRHNVATEGLSQLQMLNTSNIAAADRASKEQIAALDRSSREQVAEADRAKDINVANIRRDSDWDRALLGSDYALVALANKYLGDIKLSDALSNASDTIDKALGELPQYETEVPAILSPVMPILPNMRR